MLMPILKEVITLLLAKETNTARKAKLIELEARLAELESKE